MPAQDFGWGFGALLVGPLDRLFLVFKLRARLRGRTYDCDPDCLVQP